MTARSSAKVGPFLSGIRMRDGAQRGTAYPWSVPAIGSFATLAFPSAVTFLMGENGCGKSTLLEALAIACRAVAVGADSLETDASFAGARTLAGALVTSMVARRPAARLFFRAEDALGFGKRVSRDMSELADIAGDIEADDGAGAAARTRAAAFVRAQRRALGSRYGDDPHAQSHGEAFARILSERLVPNGIYFLDEPETPLSPTRVLALLVTLRACVRAGSQFVIATHSPLLAALPDATVYVLSGERIVATAYDELEHVRITRDFLRSPERYLRLLES
jgi:predicted ATPase